MQGHARRFRLVEKTVELLAGGFVMRRNHIIIALVVVAVAAATFGLTEKDEAGYPFTGFLGD